MGALTSVRCPPSSISGTLTSTRSRYRHLQQLLSPAPALPLSAVCLPPSAVQPLPPEVFHTPPEAACPTPSKAAHFHQNQIPDHGRRRMRVSCWVSAIGDPASRSALRRTGRDSPGRRAHSRAPSQPQILGHCLSALMISFPPIPSQP